MTHEYTQPSVNDIDAEAAKRFRMISAGTSAAEFILSHTTRDEETGELHLRGDLPFDPETSHRYYGILAAVEETGLDTKAALGVSRDETTALRKKLRPGSSSN